MKTKWNQEASLQASLFNILLMSGAHVNITAMMAQKNQSYSFMVLLKNYKKAAVVYPEVVWFGW